MPIKISSAASSETAASRLDKFRQTIPDGEGYTGKELAALLELSESRLRAALNHSNWTIMQLINGHLTRVLVNPKTLAAWNKSHK